MLCRSTPCRRCPRCASTFSFFRSGESRTDSEPWRDKGRKSTNKWICRTLRSITGLNLKQLECKMSFRSQSESAKHTVTPAWLQRNWDTWPVLYLRYENRWNELPASATRQKSVPPTWQVSDSDRQDQTDPGRCLFHQTAWYWQVATSTGLAEVGAVTSIDFWWQFFGFLQPFISIRTLLYYFGEAYNYVNLLMIEGGIFSSLSPDRCWFQWLALQWRQSCNLWKTQLDASVSRKVWPREQERETCAAVLGPAERIVLCAIVDFQRRHSPVIWKRI